MADLTEYLNLSYRKNVMGEMVDPDSALDEGPEYLAALKAELARIKNLGFGSSLAQRDFALYQHQRAIEAAIARLEKRNASGT